MFLYNFFFFSWYKQNVITFSRILFHLTFIFNPLIHKKTSKKIFPTSHPFFQHLSLSNVILHRITVFPSSSLYHHEFVFIYMFFFVDINMFNHEGNKFSEVNSRLAMILTLTINKNRNLSFWSFWLVLK